MDFGAELLNGVWAGTTLQWLSMLAMIEVPVIWNSCIFCCHQLKTMLDQRRIYLFWMFECEDEPRFLSKLMETGPNATGFFELVLARESKLSISGAPVQPTGRDNDRRRQHVNV